MKCYRCDCCEKDLTEEEIIEAGIPHPKKVINRDLTSYTIKYITQRKDLCLNCAKKLGDLFEQLSMKNDEEA